jgi:hypothetical protein
MALLTIRAVFPAAGCVKDHSSTFIGSIARPIKTNNLLGFGLPHPKLPVWDMVEAAELFSQVRPVIVGVVVRCKMGYAAIK